MGEPSDGLRKAFQEAGLRLTTQRRIILEVLKESEEHLEADTLHHRARLHAPGLSLATVYRTLALLKEMGLIEEHRLGEGHSHYEAVQREPHYHFTCQRCGQVIEFDAAPIGTVRRYLSEREGVRITNCHLHLNGYCRECKD